jgi:hypothetical protein
MIKIMQTEMANVAISTMPLKMPVFFYVGDDSNVIFV